MILRIYSGDDGLSHFEDTEIPFEASGVSPVQAVKSISFHRQEPGRFVDFHTISERAYFITLSGEGELSNGNGEVRHVGPGTISLCEDFTGKGHSMRIVSNEPRVFVRIVLS